MLVMDGIEHQTVVKSIWPLLLFQEWRVDYLQRTNHQAQWQSTQMRLLTDTMSIPWTYDATEICILIYIFLLKCLVTNHNFLCKSLTANHWSLPHNWLPTHVCLKYRANKMPTDAVPIQAVIINAACNRRNSFEAPPVTDTSAKYLGEPDANRPMSW